MKKFIYIAAFTALGILLQFLIHAAIEIFYIRFLTADFDRYGFGLTWPQWFTIHTIFSIVLLIAGIGFGLWQGVYWWRQIYVLKRWRKLTKVR